MSQKILIVDDEAHIRLLLEQTLEELEDEDVEFFFADNGEKALEIAQEERPQLILLDVMMPKMNGYDVCRRIKRDLGMQDIVIILLTAKGQEQDKEKGKEVGADFYITKPFNPDEIIGRAREILGLEAD
jgi:DNA-binding response OmpR family regulator